MEVLKIARSADWWEYKIPPLLAIGYATVLLSNADIASASLKILLLLLSLMVGAVYVSVINDITDIEEDFASGKSNRIAKISPRFRWMLPALCIVLGLGFTYIFLDDKLTVSMYVMAWISFSLYSIPPVRLKNRAGWGLLADASGAHLFTGLFMVSGITYLTGNAINWIWFIAVGIWSLAYGLRGILWHQFLDRTNDINAGINTFATNIEPFNFKSKALVLTIVELSAFTVMLIVNFKILTVVFLVIYCVMMFDRRRKFKMEIITVVSHPDRPYQILMGEYYQVFFPLSLLISGAIINPLTWLILVIHIALFPLNVLVVIRHIVELIRQEFI